jgi:hypothetical protein
VAADHDGGVQPDTVALPDFGGRPETQIEVAPLQPARNWSFADRDPVDGDAEDIGETGVGDWRARSASPRLSTVRFQLRQYGRRIGRPVIWPEVPLIGSLIDTKAS